MIVKEVAEVIRTIVAVLAMAIGDDLLVEDLVVEVDVMEAMEEPIGHEVGVIGISVDVEVSFTDVI